MRLVIGISGASGVIYGIRLLEMLQAFDEVETHLVMSRYGRLNIELETDYRAKDVEALADVVHGERNQAATISSGSFGVGGIGRSSVPTRIWALLTVLLKKSGAVAGCDARFRKSYWSHLTRQISAARSRPDYRTSPWRIPCPEQ